MGSRVLNTQEAMVRVADTKEMTRMGLGMWPGPVSTGAGAASAVWLAVVAVVVVVTGMEGAEVEASG